MGMGEVLEDTYPNIINRLQKRERRKISLLFGNGFSMSYDQEIFSYNALSDFVRKCKDETIIKIFKIVASTNFEQIMRDLGLFLRFAKEFAPNAHLEDKIIPAQDALKKNLINAITALHPEHVFSVSDPASQSCAQFLKPFIDSKGSIFSTNYDLLLYWILMRKMDIFDGAVDDGFRKSDGDDLVWESGEQNIYYLHGSLPLFCVGADTIKEQYSGDYLLSRITSRITNNQYPIFVTAGTAQEKMEVIARNHYLSYCHDQLAQLDGSLVIFGFGFGENDMHIVEAIKRASTPRKGKGSYLCSIYIGYFSPADKARILEIKDYFAGAKKVVIFDAKSVSIWK